jgi:hypothetical protein
MVIGETTLDERILRQLRWLEEVKTKYSTHLGGELKNAEWVEDLVSQLIFDATYLATYYGIDLDTIIKETVEETRKKFPETA